MGNIYENINYIINNGYNPDNNIYDIDRGTTYLMEMCDEGDIDFVEKLINAKANIEARDNNGWTPLMFACAGGHLDVVELLIKKGADINARDNEGITPIGYACLNGHIDIADFLIQNGADINNEDMPPLLGACATGNIEVVEFLIDNGANINVQNKDGLSPLHFACRGEHIDVVKILIDRGADINILAYGELSPLLSACGIGALEIVKFLVENGARTDGALELAKHLGFKDIVKYLEETVKVFEIVDFLIENGMDVDSVAERKDKVTHLMEMCDIGNIEYVEKLVNAGADVNAKDANGQSPLFWAVKAGNIPVIKFLIDNGADVNVKNKKGSTLVDFALSIGNLEIARALKNNTLKSEISKVNKKDTTLDTDNLEFSMSEYLKCATVITKIITLKGKEILQEKNKQKFSSLVSDYFERDTDLASVIKSVISTGFGQILFDADSKTEKQKNTAIDKSIKIITEKTDNSEDDVKLLVEVFTSALEWNLEI